MTDKETARSMLKNYLPESILKYINLDNMEIEKDSMIEEELKDIFSDLIYKISLNGKDAYLYFLFEHKSYPYNKVALQLLKYMRNIWELKTKQSNEKLPLIIPLVFYHGRQRWNIGVKLSDALDDIPVELKEYIPDYRYLLYDFSYTNEQEIEIKGKIKLRIFLQILRYIFVDDIMFKDEIKRLAELFEELNDKKTAMEYFEAVMRYILNSREGLDAKEISRIISEVSSERGEAVMTIAEKLRMEGKQEGIKEGKYKRNIEIAKNMLELGMEIEQIIKVTDIDEEKIRLIKEEIKH